jgi:glycine/D-amino acid oxidase-like deaminating enzyme
VDVLIVGSGYTGLSAALTLARGGRSVLVCEAGAIGEGASTRNGAHVGAKLRPSLTKLTAHYGEARAMALWREALAARKYIGQLIEQEAIKCDFIECGRFLGAYKEADFGYLVGSAEVLNAKLGYPFTAVSRKDQSKVVDTDAYFGGVIDHTTAAFHPGKFIAEAARLVTREGARIASHTRVNTVTRERSGFRALTEKGTVTAKNVILATNGYTGPEFGHFQRRIIPIGSYIIATQELSEEFVDRLFPGCRVVADTRRCASYMRVSPDGRRVVYGGRVAATEISPEVSGPRLKAVLDRIFPQLRGTTITHSWMGFTGFTFDDVPHIGVHDGMHYAMGYCGTSGTSLGVYLGHKIALKVLGAADAETAFDTLPFETRSWYRGNPWFLSTAVAYYRMRDWLRI